MTSFEPKMKKNQGVRADSRAFEAGSIVVWIFVLIALFAALGYVLSQGTRTGEQNLGRYQADLSSSEILSYGRTIKDAVRILQIEGCADEQISFESPLLAGYTNAGAPADESCHVFSTNGGGLFYKAPPNNINGGQDVIFTGNNDGSGIGTECNLARCADLIMIYPDISEQTCQEINEKLDIASGTNFLTQEADQFDVTLFTGTYAYSDRILDGASELDERYSGCVEGNLAPQSAGTYYFYQVLIAR